MAENRAEVAIPANTSWVDVIRPRTEAIFMDIIIESAAPAVAPTITE